MSSSSSSVMPRRTFKRRRTAQTGVPRRFPMSTRANLRYASRSSQQFNNKVYTFRQTVSTLATIGGSPAGWYQGTTTNDPYVAGAATGAPGTATFVSGAMAFQLADLNQVTTFTALFDQYKLTGVRVQFMPIFNENGQSGGSSAGDLYTAVDYDDATALADLNVFRQRADTRMTPSWKGTSHYLKPHVALAAYGGAFTSFANQGNQWLDCANTGVQHYGLKYAIANQGSNTAIPKWTVKITYYLSFRNVL